MNQFLHDYFWIHIVIIVILFGTVFYFTPKLMKFLDKIGGDGKKAGVKKNEPGKTAEKNKSRYKTF